MELDKFIKDNGSYFKWVNIEKDAEIPNSALRAFVAGNRGLSSDSFDKLQKFFSRFGIELEYSVKKPVNNKSTRKTVRVGDIVSMDGWIQTLGRNVKKGTMRGVIENGMVRITVV